MSRYVWTNNRAQEVKTVTVKELIEKYTVLVEDYKDTIKLYREGTAEHENLKVQLEMFKMILNDLKSIRI